MNVIAVDRPVSAKAAWICLAVAWALFLLPIPGVGLFVGVPLNIVGFILAIVVMAKGRTAKGLMPLLASIIVSPIIYLIGLAIFGMVVSKDSYDKYAERAQAASAPVSVEATTLFADYKASRASADGKYQGRNLAVSGTVVGINKGVGDAAYVGIDGGDSSLTVHARGIPEDVAAKLERGAVVALECKGAGQVDGSPILEDCKVK